MFLKMNSRSGILIVIAGPTCVGKTDVAIDLAQKLQTEIISADSRQMYRELSIGTAKPTMEQLSATRHHFIDNLSITDYYNASKFEVEVLELLNQLFNKYSIIIMTGGSGLYIDAVVNGIDDFPEIDTRIRNSFLDLFNIEGIEGLRIRLKKVDPDYYHTVDLQNHKRILKALEITTMTGIPYSTLLTRSSKIRPFKILKIGLNSDREKLYSRIDQRVDLMVSKGLENEARNLYPYKQLNSLNTVGYKEFFNYFDNQTTRDKAIELIKRNSRRYAKRQITWFTKKPDLYHWYDTSIGNRKIVDELLSLLEK